uniref:2-phytyl-1 4-beta-naphthoquinone methyltransferaseic n=1 Tax=Rhizophora mucronata TaxID=61149 RepID=A0A2P2IN63_RHIMU
MLTQAQQIIQIIVDRSNTVKECLTFGRGSNQRESGP